MATLTVTVNKKKFETRVKALHSAVSDLRDFWRDEFAPIFFAQIQDLFTLQGQPRGGGGRFAGGRWAPLSPRYAAWKKKAFPGMGILEATGELRDSFRWNGSSLGPGGIFEPYEQYVLVGTSVAHAGAHQYGVKARNLPARPFFSQPDKKIFGPMLKAWIARQTAKAG